MPLDFGTGVSRTLSPLDRAYAGVIWQTGKPPLDSELSLMSSIDNEQLRQYIASIMPSGFLMDPTRSEFDFKFDPLWVNHFHLGVPRSASGSFDSDEMQPVVWANINGWIIPVAGTAITTTTGVHNVVKLYPAPGSDTRVDFVFLEAWASIVQPNPSTTNKPTASTIWKYGNVGFGGTNMTDDLEDPTIGFETSKRVQVQYRIRVYGSGLGGGAGVDLANHPDGFGDPNILGRGANVEAPVAGMQWTNMREQLGDASLWRAGDGDPNNNLGTTDGYTYAIPICAVFRRSRETYVAIKQSGNPTQNGATLRTPGVYILVDPLTGAVPLLQATLGELLGSDDGKLAAYTVAVTNLNGCGLEDTAHVLTSVFLQIEDEIVGISSVDLVASTITIPAAGRGRWGTAAVGHDTGTVINQFNTRPDGLYTDQVASQDLLDLRRAVNPGDWDYSRILAHNVGALVKGTLRTAWKESNPGDTEGPVVHEVVEMYAGGGPPPNHTDMVDGPDGIRTIWSDGSTIQPDVTLMLKYDAPDVSGKVGFTNAGFDANVEWDVSADLKPIGFKNKGAGDDGWYNGSSVHLFIGGTTGELGARTTFYDNSSRDVRFVTPNEFWRRNYPTVAPQEGNQYPFSVRFINEKMTAAPPSVLSTTYRDYAPGPLYPWQGSRFERPFIVLGGLLDSTLRVEDVAVTNLTSATDVYGTTRFYLDLTGKGFNFDADGGFCKKTDDATGVVYHNDPSEVSTTLLRGERTLYGMLTNDGKDRTGASSEVYLMLFGDPDGRNNNGAFRVIGAGKASGLYWSSSYTEHYTTAVGGLVLEPLSGDFANAFDVTGNSVTVDFRSQWHNADDISEYESRTADLAIVLTDIGGEVGDGTPWDHGDVYVLGQSDGAYYAPSNMVLGTTLLYHPGRSATTRVPDEIVRFAMRGGAEETLGTYLRRSPSAIDTTFSAIGTATDETYWSPIHIGTWNRLSGYGWHAPTAPAYGAEVVGFTEQYRENECLTDRGSKTVLFRPFRNRDMTLQAMTWTSGMATGDCLLGPYLYPDTTAKDTLQLLTGDDGGTHSTTGKRMGIAVPREFMPRFGRQDIPYRQLNTGAVPTLASFMPGINHLFTDVTDVTNPVFDIIGGERNAGGSEVNPLFLVTRATEIAYAKTNSSYGPKGIAAYGARKTTDIDPSAGADAQAVIAALAAVNSSDFGRGLEGIQMPPYMGIARLYGVYEFEDYQNKGGTAYKSNRYEMETDSAVNLIREDVDQQTLFILKDGARDLTTELKDHTYVIPSNVLDISRIPADTAGGTHAGYVDGTSVFDDFDYVVECTVFFFAQGFINENNIVLVRKRNGSYELNTDGDDPTLENVPMCIPCPAGVNDKFYSAYNRTVYQGDPFMTRDGSTRQEADYENRYGRLLPSQSWLLRTAVQQFDSAGNFVPQMANERAFEVLASMDFYTTLGTGKIGGEMFPGTSLDVGYIANSDLSATRMPLLETSNDWRIDVRAFTEGQVGNTSRAQAQIGVLDNQSLLNAATNFGNFYIRFILLDETVVTLKGYPNLTPIADSFQVDTVHHTTDFNYRSGFLPGSTPVGPTPGNMVLEAQFTPSVLVHPEAAFPTVVGSPYKSVTVTTDDTSALINDYGSVVMDARALDTGNIAVRATFVVGALPFDTPDATADPGTLRNVRSLTNDFGVIAAGATAVQAFVWVGADHTAVQTFVVSHNRTSGLIAEAYASAADEVTVKLSNITAAPIDPDDPGSIVFQVAMLVDVDPAAIQIDLSAVEYTVHVEWETGSETTTAGYIASAINAHSSLQQSVRASTDGTPVVTIKSVPTGAAGNGIQVEVGYYISPVPLTVTPTLVEDTLKLVVDSSNILARGHNTTGTYLYGGVDLPVNAGIGTNQMNLTGMTERLPLGVLVQDNDFLCENPLGDTASALNGTPAPLRPIQTLMPLTGGGEEYSRFLGAPGELVAMADVLIAPRSWAAWTSTSGDTATKKFRLYRGGGVAYVLSGDSPGGPIDWVTESFPKSVQPVLKGGMLACKAMLVRNYYEEAFSGGSLAKISDGDEVQLVVLTYAHLGDGNTVDEGLTLDGIISPSGYGEGYAAADRYRCMGRPMVRGYSRETPDPATVTLAVYPEDQRGS